MSKGGRRMDPLQAMLGKRQRFEKRLGNGERMNRRTDVVDETRKRQLRRARPAANGFSRFEDANGMTRPRNFNGCRKTVRAGAGNHCFEFHRRIV